MNVRVKSLKSLGCIVLSLAFSGGLFSQGFTGKIKNNKAFITVSATGFHSVEAIAEVWGVSGSDILALNPGMTSGSIPENQAVQIPVEFIIRTENCDSCKPVYHQVAKSEGLYRIGKCYGNTPVSTLKKLNQLRSDALQPGQELLVGYVVTHLNGSNLPTGASAIIASDSLIPVQENHLPATPEPVKEFIVEEPRNELSYQGMGIFENEYFPDTTQVARRQGKAASFKSESGWKDGRFYLLCSQLKTGVVVKVIHPVAGKSIYAKVVGPLPKIKQNDKLDWRLSNAAAASLGIWDEDEIADLVLEY